MYGRLAVFSVAVSLGVAFAWLETSGAAGSTKGPLVLRVGDTVRIEGTQVGCAVARRNGATMVECLPTARKAGTYATLAGDKNVLVVQFKTSTVARTVFHARQHDSHTTTCR
jgi:hypothetical protein